MEATVIGYTLSSKMGQCLSQRHLVNTEGGGIQRGEGHGQGLLLC